PRDALIAQSVDGHEVGKSFGYHRAMDTIGSVMGPLAAVILLPMLANNYRQLFLIAFFAGLLAVITFIFVKDIKTEPVRNRPAINMFSLKQFNSPFKHYISAVFIFGLGLMPISLMLLKSQATALGSFGIPVVYLISSASFILFAIPFGKLSDKVGERKILVGGFVVAIIAYAIFALTTNVIGMIVGFIIFGIYSAMTDGIMRSLASKLVSRDQLATGQGFLNAAVGISSLLAGIIGGAIWTFWGPAAAFFYGILMMAVGLLVFLSLNGVKKELQLE
ncbi:MAG: MFS transporter, partial [bacterium]|nr:MFS transporter [bacterium]